MTITLETLGLALLLMVVFESLLPSVAPHKWQQMCRMMSTLNPARIQVIALVVLLASLALVLILTLRP